MIEWQKPMFCSSCGIKHSMINCIAYEQGRKDERERLKNLIISYNDIDTEVILERLLKELMKE